MNIFISLGILVVNIIAILVVYQFIKPLEKRDKLIVVALGIAINYMLALIVYSLSSIGMDQNISNAASSYILYIFVPINCILNVPFIASSYCKYKLEKLPKDKFRNRVIIVVAYTIIIAIFEYFYFKNVQGDIVNMVSNLQ